MALAQAQFTLYFLDEKNLVGRGGKAWRSYFK